MWILNGLSDCLFEEMQYEQNISKSQIAMNSLGREVHWGSQSSLERVNIHQEILRGGGGG